ncbi:MAG: hypothetical protein H9W81_07595 [Enterococcus sp.]|nr:hypothetical protein [Enterococcus sp.]
MKHSVDDGRVGHTAKLAMSAVLKIVILLLMVTMLGTAAYCLFQIFLMASFLKAAAIALLAGVLLYHSYKMTFPGRTRLAPPRDEKNITV